MKLDNLSQSAFHIEGGRKDLPQTALIYSEESLNASNCQ
jgi:hypothetical protein